MGRRMGKTVLEVPSFHTINRSVARALCTHELFGCQAMARVFTTPEHFSVYRGTSFCLTSTEFSFSCRFFLLRIYLDLPGSIWIFLVLFGSFWIFLDLSGSFWIFLDLSGSFWIYLDLSGSIWIFLQLSGSIWIYLDLARSFWIFLDLSGFQTL